uniref:Uncharacterized protein n=1 Tax=viral metagenome TaxID=1070528 RepID=A0A6M3JRJ6_9ZZZZ
MNDTHCKISHSLKTGDGRAKPPFVVRRVDYGYDQRFLGKDNHNDWTINRTESEAIRFDSLVEAVAAWAAFLERWPDSPVKECEVVSVFEKVKLWYVALSGQALVDTTLFVEAAQPSEAIREAKELAKEASLWCIEEIDHRCTEVNWCEQAAPDDD